MKFISLLAILSIMGCASSTGPGMPDRVGGLLGAKVKDGPCLETGIVLFMFPSPTDMRGAVFQLDKGCRCAYTVNGVEYMPTQVFPQEMCEAYRLQKLKEQEKTSGESGTEQSTEPATTTEN